MPTGQGGSPFTGLLPLLAIWFLIFYMLVFRPQNRAKKDREQMIKNLKKHDEVVTVGGIYGTVMNVKPDRVTLRVDENVRIDVDKSAIDRLVKAKGGEPELVGAEQKA
jgi:preprotein translocase subunit YajC